MRLRGSGGRQSRQGTDHKGATARKGGRDRYPADKDAARHQGAVGALAGW